MKNKLIAVLLGVILLLLLGCREDDVYEGENQTFSLTAIMPDDESLSRVSLVENEKNVTLGWEKNDQIHLVFVQGETKVKQVVTVENISDDGKKASFSITLPDAILPGTFGLHGLYGGGGLDDTDPVLAILPPMGITTSLHSIQENKDMMLSFSVQAVKTNELNRSVTFEHVGSLFNITLKNSGADALNNVGGAQLISEEEGWAINNQGEGHYNLATGEFSNISSVSNNIFFKAGESNVPEGESISFWGWIPIPADVKWPELRMQLVDTSNEVMYTTVNSKSERTEVTTVGKSYYFYTVWNGMSLAFTDDSYEPGGNAEYVERAYHPKVRAGHNRVEVTWLLKNTKDLHGYTVYWDNGTSSVSGVIPAKANNVSGSLLELPGLDYGSFVDDIAYELYADTIAVIIAGLTEDTYRFEIIMHDEYGNVSEMIPVEGVSYGANYIETLTQTSLKYAYRESDDVTFEWHIAPPNAIGVEIGYVNSAGQQASHFTSYLQLRDVVKNVSEGEELIYRTLYLPAPCALDTFYTEYATVTLTEPRVYDKHPWDMVLIYTGGAHRTSGWFQRNHFDPYIALDRNDETFDWLFDGFLFLEIRDGEKSFFGSHGSIPANKEDWTSYIEKFVAPNLNMSALNDQIEVQKSKGRETSLFEKRKIIIGIPEAKEGQKNWGSLNGKNLDFDLEEDRIVAYKWFVDYAIERFNSQNYQNLELVAFYWIQEGTRIENTIEAMSEYVHGKNYFFYWIPHFVGANNVNNNWQVLGFDRAYLQPGYFYRTDTDYWRLAESAQRVNRYQFVPYVEFDTRVLRSNGNWGYRLDDTIDVFGDYGFWDTQPIGYYQGFDGWCHLSISVNQQDKNLYHRLAEIIARRQRSR